MTKNQVFEAMSNSASPYFKYVIAMELPMFITYERLVTSIIDYGIDEDKIIVQFVGAIDDFTIQIMSISPFRTYEVFSDGSFNIYCPLDPLFNIYKLKNYE